MIEFGPEICGDPERALEREWLQTNGIGGYASSTILCANTRRYHGLLTAALDRPRGRFVLLSKLEPVMLAGSAEYPLCSNIYPGAIYPSGFQSLRRFRLDPYPVFTFETAGRVIEKRLAMAQGENTVVAQYTLVAGDPCRLDVRPLIAFRGYHETTHENAALARAVEQQPGAVSIQPYPALPRMFVSHTRAELRIEQNWYYNLVYPRERERGLDDLEDLFSPFRLTFSLKAGDSAVITASTLPDRAAAQLAAVFDRERERRSKLRARAPRQDDLAATLSEATDAFLIGRPDGATSVIAGYHWFTEWGRDTMISLAGLTLVPGRFDLAKKILLAWAAVIDNGMLPNRFPDGSAQPEYNSVDASLWMFEAVRKYVEYTGDFDLVRESLYERLVSIIDAYASGTRFGIRSDSDGLIIAGGEGTQLTWMDAMAGGRPATPRHGKPVEIQGLWYNALGFAEWLARTFGRDAQAKSFADRAELAKSSFAARFPNPATGCLFDVIDRSSSMETLRDDASIRPNQVIAMSLGFPILAAADARRILPVIERHLMTRFGLRTLAPSDPQYQGIYEGGVQQRDSRYHQGAIWPWLLGHFITAWVRAFGRSAENMHRAAQWIAPFEEHLREAGLGYVSELFDGDAPHHARGCIAQAWSVAEILRAKVEDVDGIRPRLRIPDLEE